MTIRNIIFIILLTSLTTQSQNHCAVIDSLSGKAEIQRDSQHEWQFIRAGGKIYNNDIIKTLHDSHVRLKWLDSTSVFINSNTQLQINFTEKKNNSFLSHITLVSGELFFYSPGSFHEKRNNEFKIYSPVISASSQNTSFLITSKQSNPFTEIKILQGVLELRSLKNIVKIFIGSSYKTSVKSTTDPIPKYALLQEDIDSLRLWVPSDVIDKVMDKQLRDAKRTYQILNGKLEDKCLIISFQNNSEYNGAWDLRKCFPIFFMQRLQIINKNLRSEVSDTVTQDPLSIALLKKARFLLTGEIITFDIIQHAEITAQADEYMERRIARVKLNLKVTETQTGKNVVDSTITGEVAQKRVKENSWETVKLLPFDLQDSSFTSSILGLAITQVLDQGAEVMAKLYEEK